MDKQRVAAVPTIQPEAELVEVSPVIRRPSIDRIVFEYVQKASPARDIEIQLQGVLAGCFVREWRMGGCRRDAYGTTSIGKRNETNWNSKLVFPRRQAGLKIIKDAGFDSRRAGIRRTPETFSCLSNLRLESGHTNVCSRNENAF
jgi:hypothetical protein